MNSNYLRIVSLLALLFACTYAVASDMMIKKSAQGVFFVTGGISEEEVDALKPYAKRYSLHLVFSEGTSGRSATDVNVNIYDINSKLVFRVTNAQPQLYVKLPAGTYTILASFNGDKLRHKFELADNAHKKIILNWKNLTDEDMPLDGEGN